LVVLAVEHTPYDTQYIQRCKAQLPHGVDGLSPLPNLPRGIDGGGRPMKGEVMTSMYEYKFVRIGEYAGSALFGVRDRDRNAYEAIVHEHARDGWRLAQIFAPGVAAFGAAKYYELIFERETSDSATAPTAELQTERLPV
jgi:hypothetical protein